MIRNRCNLRKYATVLALTVSAMFFLPEALFGKGAIVGYVYGKRVQELNLANNALPSNDQLSHMTHVMAVSLKTNTDGTLDKTNLPNRWVGNNTNNKNIWLDSLVIRAHARGVKVSIVC